MADETRRDWEDVQVNDQDKTQRLVVPGGFLYRVITTTNNLSIVFVPKH